MAKTFYSTEETLAKLGCSEDQIRGLVRSGKLREFRDAGKLSYKIEEVDRLVADMANLGLDSGELSLEETGDIVLSSADSDSGDALSLSGTSDVVDAGASSDAPIDLGGSDSSALGLSGSGSSALGLSGSGEIRLEDSGAGAPAKDDSSIGGSGADVMSLDEVDKDAVEGMKKDDTVITNIGISVFDDDDLEIASADPMAKTLLTGADEHLGLDGSGGGSGLLDLTRESDDTSLGAELLEGIDMGDTAETMAPTMTEEAAEPGLGAGDDVMGDVGTGSALALGQVYTVGMVQAASPAFTGLLIAAVITLGLAGAMSIATSLNAWPGYLDYLAERFWLFSGSTVGLGGLAALIGFLVGRPSSGPRGGKAKGKGKAKAKKGAKTGEQELLSDADSQL